MRPLRSRWLGLVTCVLFACNGRGGDAASMPEEPDKPAPAPAPEPSAQAPSAVPPPPLPDLAAHMRDHFGVATQVRDAVSAADVKQAEGPLTWLAQHTYKKEVPETWWPYVKPMQEAATAALNSANDGARAQAVAELARQCGACHQALGKGPNPEPQGFEEDLGEPAPEQTRERMHRHMWAAERMWEGLIVPSDKLFEMGAAVLAEAPKVAGGDRALRAGLDAVRALGKRASEAEAPEARTKIFGEFIQACHGCHSARGVRPTGP